MSGEPLVIVHKEPGQILSSDEYGDTHPNTVPGAAEHSLVEVLADGTVAGTTTPLVSKIGINQVTEPVKELEMAAGEGEFEYPVELLHRGQSQGNFGRHQNDRLEFLHAFLDETSGTDVADETGHWPGTFDGTLSNVSAGLPSGLASAMVFDEEDFVDLGKIAMRDWEGFSLSVWFRIDDSPFGSWTPLAHNVEDTTTGPAGWHLRYAAPTDRLYFVHGSTVIWAPDIAEETWYHAVATIYRGREMRLYIDGALIVSQILDPVTENWSLDAGGITKIGSFLVGGLGMAEGAMADARIFARAITPEEVLKIYAGGAGTLEPLRALLAPGEGDRWAACVVEQAPAVYQVTSADRKLEVSRAVRWMQVAGDGWRYGVIGKVDAGAVSVAGAPFAGVTDFIAFEVGRRGGVRVERWKVQGSFAAAMVSGDYFDWRFASGQADEVLVAIRVHLETDDTGANQPRVNVELGGSAVSTANSNEGPEGKSSDWTPKLLPAAAGTNWVEIDPANADYDFGVEGRLRLTEAGSNKDAVGLSVELIFVQK